jgi:hypothetical protein
VTGRQHRIVDHHVDLLGQRRQVLLGHVERNRLGARRLDQTLLVGIGIARDREDLVVLGEFDGNGKRDKAARSGDQNAFA